jgi:hypothetical protein
MNSVVVGGFTHPSVDEICLDKIGIHWTAGMISGIRYTNDGVSSDRIGKCSTP